MWKVHRFFVNVITFLNYIQVDKWTFYLSMDKKFFEMWLPAVSYIKELVIVIDTM